MNGVYKRKDVVSKGKPWIACINWFGKTKYLGSFPTEGLARKARRKADKEKAELMKTMVKEKPKPTNWQVIQGLLCKSWV